MDEQTPTTSSRDKNISSIDRSNLLTEQRLPESMNLDHLPIAAAVDLMNQQDAIAVQAVAAQRDDIAAAVAMVAESLKNNGRLIYIGAGTSGRLGVLDASECPPTFGVDPRMVQGIIAGGEAAMFRSQEGAEDHPEGGAAAVDAKRVTSADVVMGIAAGGTTPFVRGGLARARELGAKTIFLCCVQPTALEPEVDIIIRPLTGPEVLTGSTRLKAGTATKLVLNQITTLAMVQLGKVYENLMVDLRASNKKLQDRSARIVATITGSDVEKSRELLKNAGGDVKTAIIMQKRGVDRAEAENILKSFNGELRRATEGGNAGR
jgi:N-acetylmuramic acid 6-phosphate etherase